MPTTLIAYGSTHGHTAKIVRRIAAHLHDAGVVVRLCNVGAGEHPGVLDQDGVIVAASVHRGSHQPEVVQWAQRNHAGLERHPNAFLSISLTAAEDDEESRKVTQDLIDGFARETGWTPETALSVAGALQYREYDFFTRTLMRLLMKKGGHPTDTSQDYDYTDWDAVDRFADEFARQVVAAAAGEVAVT